MTGPHANQANQANHAMPDLHPRAETAAQRGASAPNLPLTLGHQPPLPADTPVFAEPWQAQAFALALQLHQRGLFTWPEWAAALSAQINAAQAAGDPDLGNTYWQHWLAALEQLVAQRGAGSSSELARTARAWATAAGRTPHGAPITLTTADYPPPG